MLNTPVRKRHREFEGERFRSFSRTASPSPIQYVNSEHGSVRIHETPVAKTTNHNHTNHSPRKNGRDVCINCINRSLSKQKAIKREQQRDRHAAGLLIENPEQDYIHHKRVVNKVNYAQALRKQIESNRAKSKLKTQPCESYLERDVFSKEREQARQRQANTKKHLQALSRQIQDRLMEKETIRKDELRLNQMLSQPQKAYVDNGVRTQVYSMYHETDGELRLNDREAKCSYFNRQLAQRKREEAKAARLRESAFREQRAPVSRVAKGDCQDCGRVLPLKLLSRVK